MARDYLVIQSTSVACEQNEIEIGTLIVQHQRFVLQEWDDTLGIEKINDNITIEVGNNPYKNDGNLTHIKLPNISSEIFQIILRYIYGKRLSLEEYDPS
ncbi:hypothetical protein C1645_829775 [Glomus cerebriforme]|uniref:BTB domain-containing protein n=1 Tax=Glomus cerebriforme TaxID=658196 RepID=A0A397SJ92_9GLOM|nr:hypothetical protein C1645_829775 [Glomus cerebriforme]